MSAQAGMVIAGIGSYAPERVLTNRKLERMVDTSDEWIRARTGICERRIGADSETTADMAHRAAERALASAGMAADALDLIVVATITPDTALPNTGCHLQRRLGIAGCPCFSLEAACSGFIYGLAMAYGFINAGLGRTVLVVGADKLSAVTDWTDRNTCVLFGDGAGAAVVQAVPREQDSCLACRLGADGHFADLLHIPSGGTAVPLTAARLEGREDKVRMAGREVFKLAVNAMSEACAGALSDAGYEPGDVDWLVPHQANQRIIGSIGRRLGIPAERVYVNLDRYGNTSAASIPLALDEMVRADALERDQLVLLTAFGGGLTWGSLLLRW